ncbi:MAG: histidine kinase [Synergistetes bacterium]|nr:histidine kinase [Synergistota bacterium]
MKEDLLKLLSEIQDKILGALKDAHSEVHSIGEEARRELQSLYLRREKLASEIEKIIGEVDEAEKSFEVARKWLAKVSADFSKYSEQDIKEAYGTAEKKQLNLFKLRERERSLRRERDEVDRRIRELERLVGKVDELAKRLKVAMDLLSGNIEKVQREILELKGRAELAPMVVQALEKERKRLAREIHDGPAQYLANAIFRLDICERFLEMGDLGRVRKEISGLKEILQANLSDVRRFITDLRPMLLEDLGLVSALNRYIEEWKKLSGIDVEFKVLGEAGDVDNKGVEVAIFRIVQEALSNIHKHACASKVKLLLEIRKDFVSVLIEDDGVGFDIEEAKKKSIEKGSLGIFSMEERARALGGTLKIVSGQGRGTKIMVRIPQGGGSLDKNYARG